jgi:hypothetical protein
MPWVEVFVVFFVSHLAGDYVLQTDWQAEHKRGGLGADPVARRALGAHVATYTLAFVPAFVWLSGEIGAEVLAVAAVIFATHLVQDDGRLLGAYVARVKGPGAAGNRAVVTAVDQSVHLITLFVIAVVVGT